MGSFYMVLNSSTVSGDIQLALGVDRELEKLSGSLQPSFPFEEKSNARQSVRAK